jgi:hypothetical protein
MLALSSEGPPPTRVAPRPPLDEKKKAPLKIPNNPFVKRILRQSNPSHILIKQELEETSVHQLIFALISSSLPSFVPSALTRPLPSLQSTHPPLCPPEYSTTRAPTMLARSILRPTTGAALLKTAVRNSTRVSGNQRFILIHIYISKIRVNWRLGIGLATEKLMQIFGIT